MSSLEVEVRPSLIGLFSERTRDWLCIRPGMSSSKIFKIIDTTDHRENIVTGSESSRSCPQRTSDRISPRTVCFIQFHIAPAPTSLQAQSHFDDCSDIVAAHDSWYERKRMNNGYRCSITARTNACRHYVYRVSVDWCRKRKINFPSNIPSNSQDVARWWYLIWDLKT